MLYPIKNIEQVNTPALIVYKENLISNIELAIKMIGDISRLRPHVKTHKMVEVVKLMVDRGVNKFKSATISESEMVAIGGGKDVLLALQPVGPAVQRLMNVVKAYPSTTFSCIVDHRDAVNHIDLVAAKNNIVLSVYIDVNIGMNRTGMAPEKALELIEQISQLENVQLTGIHAYDGHIRDEDIVVRQQHSDACFSRITPILQRYPALKIVAGGTPTFTTHLHRKDIECSPGTFVFSDWGYKYGVPDQKFECAALLVSRVISIINDTHICIDLGHKAVAAENPLPRVYFLNHPDAIPISQSEEHLVLRVPNSNHFKPGDVFYGIPVHICPTVALHQQVYVAEHNEIVSQWDVLARKRMINF